MESPSSRWKDIPFRTTAGLERPVVDTGVRPYIEYQDMKQDDGLHSAVLEHHPSAPEVVVPAHISKREGIQSEPTSNLGEVTEEGPTNDVKPPRPKRGFLRLRRFWILVLVAFLVLGLALGLGLGLTIGRKKPNGAMGGSGVVGLDLGDGSSRITLYSQHANREIRQAQYKDGVWTGGTSQDTVLAYNARAGTPLMAVSYAHKNELTWRVFYFDDKNILQESINSNKSTGWSSGLLGTSKFEASSSAHAGLSACYNRRWYGDPFGLRLYYGSARGSVQELTWNYGDGAWTKGYTFPDSNPNGGCECTVRGSSITNLWLLNTKGELEQRWCDFNTSAKPTIHPTGTWVKQLTYNPVLPNTSIAAINHLDTKNVHLQAPNASILQLIANGSAENSAWADSFQVGTQNVKGIRGTKISSVVLNTTEGGQEIHVLFMEDGDGGKAEGRRSGMGVVDYVRTLVGGTWARIGVEVG